MVKESKYFHIGNSPLYKSYGYIGNSMYQYIRIMEADGELIHTNVFYIADYKPLSLVNWANLLSKSFGANKVRSIPVVFAKILGYVGDFINFIGFEKFPFNSFRLNNILTEYIFDLSKTEDIVGELPYTVTDGVNNTVRWFLGRL